MSDCGSVARTVVHVVTTVLVNPSSAVAVMSEVVSLDSDWESVATQSLAASKVAMGRYASRRDCWQKHQGHPEARLCL